MNEVNPATGETPMGREEFGPRFQAWRLRQGMCVDNAAERFGVSHGTINSWESGRSLPPVQLRASMARILRVAVEAIPVANMGRPRRDPLVGENERRRIRYAERRAAAASGGAAMGVHA